MPDISTGCRGKFSKADQIGSIDFFIFSSFLFDLKVLRIEKSCLKRVKKVDAADFQKAMLASNVGPFALIMTVTTLLC